ncbi:MAG: TdeIII family type II restriction endonuclease [Candidatus Paceibacterota bacterium]
MGLTKEKKDKIISVLKDSLKSKFQNYNPETKQLPFHTRLLGKDRLALFSFIHSLNTTFGTSIYEPVAITLAEDRFKIAKTQEKAYNQISEAAHSCIQKIMTGLINGNTNPDKEKELENIRKLCQTGILNKVKLTKVDIWLENTNGELYLIDMKTVKPNIGEFKGFKRTLLEWAAAEMTKDPNAKVNTLIAIPYNPYHPDPYNRWTMKGMFDLPKEILVAQELWDFLGGEGTWVDLLDCFETTGIELRKEIDDYFKRFK